MLISIIIPVYNVDKYLERAIESIIMQTYSNWEIVLVDDGSTDNSSVLCDLYANKYVNIQCKHQSNQGVSVARNTGIELAKGDYYLFADPDDWLSSNMLEEMLAKGENADMIVCDTYDVIKSGGVSRLSQEIHGSSMKLLPLINTTMYFVKPQLCGTS